MDVKLKIPAVQSMIDHWTETVPGTKGLKWTKSRIAEYLNLGGIAGKIVGSGKTVADELERWTEVADVDRFNLYSLINPRRFEDIIEFVLPELRKRGSFRKKVEHEGMTAREVYLAVGNNRLLTDHPGSKHKWVRIRSHARSLNFGEAQRMPFRLASSIFLACQNWTL